MITQKIKELEATKVRLAELEKKVAAELHKELAALPANYGFSSLQNFVKALKSASSGRRGRKPGRPASAKVKSAPAGKRRRRAVITDGTRAEVKKLSEAGKTGAAIAKALRISLPSVQNIKKALGLVKARKK
jgi:hypothetical protein